MHNILEQLLKDCPKLWRTRQVAKNNELTQWLNEKYPAVPLNIQIYSFMNKISPYCTVCNKPVKSLGKTTCSLTCRNVTLSINSHSRMEKQKKTLVQKYGVKNIRNIHGAESKRKQSMIEKYGALVSPKTSDSARARSADLNAKGRETLFEKYGVTNPGMLADHQQKCKQTLSDRYGVDHYFKSDEFIAKSQAAKINKWTSTFPATVSFNSINNDAEKQYLFENPNQVISFTCNDCGTNDSAPTETIKWRLNQCGTCCVKCSGINRGSLKEQAIRDYVHSLGVVTQDNIAILGKFEIDIFIPEYNTGIEFHGLYWHNDLRVDKNYHLNKLHLASEKGIRLLQIFEDEWDNSPDIVKSRIANTLSKTQHSYAGRKCIVREISTAAEKEFLNSNHIQGYTSSSIKLGLYFNDTLVSLMTFSKPNLSKGQRKQDGRWELLRFCNAVNSNVVGGASKLLSYFKKIHHPLSIVSFADRRWSNGNLYQKLGFTMLNDGKPNYWYIKAANRIHRFGLRKNKSDNQSLTEYQNRLAQGYLRIWDCGSSKWEWNSK